MVLVLRVQSNALKEPLESKDNIIVKILVEINVIPNVLLERVPNKNFFFIFI